MNINKRGMSGIIAALILIVLVLVAAGIVWLVYNNLIKGSSENINYANKCLGIMIDATLGTCAGVIPATDPITYKCPVTLERVSGSSQESINGVGITFSDATQSSDELYAEGNVATKKIATIGPISFNPPTKVDIRIYLTKEDGEKYFCTK